MKRLFHRAKIAKYANISKDIEFSHSKDRLIIRSDVINVFKKYEQKSEADESGGILLGYVYKDRTEIVKVSVPGSLDSFAKNFFIRSKINAQGLINKSWGKSKGTLIYVGEWHTHPEKNPTSSIVDKGMIKKTLIETKMEINFLYLIIVGQNDTYWVGKQTKNKLLELVRRKAWGQAATEGSLT